MCTYYPCASNKIAKTLLTLGEEDAELTYTEGKEDVEKKKEPTENERCHFRSTTIEGNHTNVENLLTNGLAARRSLVDEWVEIRYKKGENR